MPKNFRSRREASSDEEQEVSPSQKPEDIK